MSATREKKMRKRIKYKRLTIQLIIIMKHIVVPEFEICNYNIDIIIIS